MITTDEFLNEVLQHAYDPVKAREYYLRTRKLKGRQPGSSADKMNLGSKVGYNGKPLKPIGKRIEEDEAPNVSPNGAKLVDYDGKGLGKATYADGTVYDAAVGWKSGGAGIAKAAFAKNAAERKYNANIANIDKTDKANAPKKRRIGAAEQKLIRAKTLVKRVKNPADRTALLKRLQATESKLTSVKKRVNSGLVETSKKGSSTRPVLRRQPPSGV